MVLYLRQLRRVLVSTVVTNRPTLLVTLATLVTLVTLVTNLLWLFLSLVQPAQETKAQRDKPARGVRYDPKVQAAQAQWFSVVQWHGNKKGGGKGT
jgi:hypothetical protein